MKLNDFIKVLNEEYGSKTYIKIYLKFENGRLTAEPKKIWYGKLNTLKKQFNRFACMNYEITWISNSTLGLGTTMTLFVKESTERKEAA